MNRLTRKHKPTNYTRYTEKTICLKNYNIRNANLNKAIEKLGKLEDLEEELGCPLEVVFKALKDGIYKKDEDILFEATLRIHNNEIYLCQPYDDKLLHKVLVKDYQKTWWLKGEKENV